MPYRAWWRYIAAVLPFHILVEWQVAMPPPQIVVAFVTNCAVAILNALFIKQLLVSLPWLSSFPRALLFVIGTVCVNPAVVAFGGAFVRISMVEEMHQYWTYWAQWYAANALASLTLGREFSEWALMSLGNLPIPKQVPYSKALSRQPAVSSRQRLAANDVRRTGAWAR